jgi:two-component system CheB/CheR fusion protein
LSHDGDIEEYVRRLEDDPAEVDLLYQDLLIGVTRFFRDREAFEVLRNDVLPQMLLKHNDHDEFRVWVAACATGEEAYSMAVRPHPAGRTRRRPKRQASRPVA